MKTEKEIKHYFESLIGKRFTIGELNAKISNLLDTKIEFMNQPIESGYDFEIYTSIDDENNQYNGYYEMCYINDNDGKMYITDTYVELYKANKPKNLYLVTCTNQSLGYEIADISHLFDNETKAKQFFNKKKNELISKFPDWEIVSSENGDYFLISNNGYWNEVMLLEKESNI